MRKFLTTGRISSSGSLRGIRVGYTWLARRRGRDQSERENNTTTTEREMALASRDKDRDLERLIPIGGSLGITDNVNGTIGSKSSSPSESPLASLLYPITPAERHLAKSFVAGLLKSYVRMCHLVSNSITFYVTWWFIHFVDGFFSPIYAHLGINVFGLGFVTSITFIFLVGVFMSSWLGASVLGLGEWIIKKMPLMSYIYTASKQISAAISPDQHSHAFKEVAIVRHPRIGEYALGFITSSVILRKTSGSEELCCVYVPTNHLYLGDIFLINSKDIMRPNLSVREGIEIVISGGMSIPKILNIVDVQSILSPRVGKFAIPQV